MLKIYDRFNAEILKALDDLGLSSNNRDYQLYTLNHKQAFMAVQAILKNEITKSGTLHDLDKLVTYGILTKSEASRLHRKYATHHINLCKTAEDLEDCVIDYECARFTKSDKPLDAIDTILKYCPDKYDILLPAINKFELDTGRYFEPRFSYWNQLKSDELQLLINKNIREIKKLYSNIEKFGVEKGVEKFYAK